MQARDLSLGRREFCYGVTVALTTLLASPAYAQSGEQRDWRFCGKCHQMFFDGYADKGRCAAGGGHAAIGFVFKIEYSMSRQQELPGRRRQYDWRFCNKCHTLFYDGYSEKGVCPRGGGHVAQGFIFGLWDTEGPTFPGSARQRDWRFCNKCHSLFFDGYPDKGRCPAGRGHLAQGLNFVIFHDPDTAPATPAATVPPAISIRREESAFLVSGSGFLPSSPVTVRVADDFANPNLFYQTSSDSEGGISAAYKIPCRPGRLYFSANDGRRNSSDVTGALWSNTVAVSC